MLEFMMHFDDCNGGEVGTDILREAFGEIEETLLTERMGRTGRTGKGREGGSAGAGRSRKTQTLDPDFMQCCP